MMPFYTEVPEDNVPTSQIYGLAYQRKVRIQQTIDRLLEEARAAERLEALCKRNRQFARANVMHGKAGAYYHAARLLGWSPLGDDEPVPDERDFPTVPDAPTSADAAAIEDRDIAAAERAAGGR